MKLISYAMRAKPKGRYFIRIQCGRHALGMIAGLACLTAEQFHGTAADEAEIVMWTCRVQ